MNTPDTEVDAYSRGYKQGRFDSEMDRLNEEKPTPDTEWEKEFDEMCEKSAHAYRKEDCGLLKPCDQCGGGLDIDAVKSFLSSRDTYWKERVRKEVEGILLRHTNWKPTEGYGSDEERGFQKGLIAEAKLLEKELLQALDNLK